MNKLLLILSTLFIAGCGSLSLINDGFQFYDDFDTGVRIDKWVYTTELGDCRSSQVKSGVDSEIAVIDGKARLSSLSLSGCNAFKTDMIISERDFFGEDLIIKYDYEYVDGGSPAGRQGFIQIGGNSLPITLGESNVNGRHRKDGLIEITSFDDLDPGKKVIFLDGNEVGNFKLDNPAPLVIQGIINVDHVRFRPFFGCEIDADKEVVVRDTFAAGSKVNIDSLSFSPTKFCPQDLGVLIISDAGLTDEKGSLTERVAQGQTLTVPDNTIYRFEYVAFFEEGMREKCNIGEAYDTVLEACVSVSSSGGQVSLPPPEVIFVGDKNSVGFTSAPFLEVTGQSWSNGIRIDPSCDQQNPENECFISDVEWALHDFTVGHGESVDVTENIRVSYLSSGVDNQLGIPLSNNYVLEYDDVFDIQLDRFDSVAVLNKHAEACFDVENRIFGLQDSGFTLQTANRLVDRFESTSLVSTTLPPKTSQLCVKLPTDTLGQNDAEVGLYFDMLDEDFYFSDERVSFSYFVVADEDEVESIEIREKRRNILTIIWEFFRSLLGR